ncbi:TPA: hypothetical protein ACGO54_001288 [Streptococcus suis]
MKQTKFVSTAAGITGVGQGEFKHSSGVFEVGNKETMFPRSSQ